MAITAVEDVEKSHIDLDDMSVEILQGVVHTLVVVRAEEYGILAEALLSDDTEVEHQHTVATLKTHRPMAGNADNYKEVMEKVTEVLLAGVIEGADYWDSAVVIPGELVPELPAYLNPDTPSADGFIYSGSVMHAGFTPIVVQGRVAYIHIHVPE